MPHPSRSGCLAICTIAQAKPAVHRYFLCHPSNRSIYIVAQLRCCGDACSLQQALGYFPKPHFSGLIERQRRTRSDPVEVPNINMVSRSASGDTIGILDEDDPLLAYDRHSGVGPFDHQRCPPFVLQSIGQLLCPNVVSLGNFRVADFRNNHLASDLLEDGGKPTSDSQLLKICLAGSRLEAKCHAKYHGASVLLRGKTFRNISVILVIVP